MLINMCMVLSSYALTSATERPTGSADLSIYVFVCMHLYRYI